MTQEQQRPQGELRVIDGGASSVEHADGRLDFDLQAEASVLSNVLYDVTMLDVVRPFLAAEHFYSEAHRRIYEAACAVRDKALPLDVTTVATELRDSGRLKQVQMSYLTSVLNAAPAAGATQVRAYAQSVRDRWVRRESSLIATKMLTRAKGDGAPIDSILSEARDHIDEMAIVLGGDEKDARLKEVLARTARRLEATQNTGGRGALPSGLDRVDRMTGGLQQTLMVLAARPGMGKTSCATFVGVNVASRKSEDGSLRNGVYFSSLETFDEEACTRLWCAEAGVDVGHARTGMLSKNDWSRLTDACSRIHTLPLWIDDQPSQTVTNLWSRVRRADALMQRGGGKIRLVIVDYLQLLRAPRPKMQREEIVAENARALLAMSKDLACPVLALAQLNRACELRPDKRPMLSDLRESGEIENAARVVMFLYRDEYYDRGTELRGVAEVIVAKQNNGPTGSVLVGWDARCTRFYNLREDNEYDHTMNNGQATTSNGKANGKMPEPPAGFYDDD